MSITKVSRGDQESFSIVTNPIRSYVTSSAGATGSVYVFARRSAMERNMAPSPAFIDVSHDDADLNTALREVQWNGRVARDGTSLTLASKFNTMLSNFLDKVDQQGVSSRKQKALDIIRFTPSVGFTSNTLRKLNLKDVLMPYYRVNYPSAHWAYTNYSSLNFFTASCVPTSSVLLYPNVDSDVRSHEGYVSGTYALSGAFSFDFHINPRYQTDEPNGSFKAGTLFHLSSSYAVSLVTGSSKDQNGRPLGYRIKLQLSHSADQLPSTAAPGNYPHDLTFLSDDNALWWNRWHHVVIRWGTNLVNQGTGSFNVDGVDRGYFVVPSGTVAPRAFPVGGTSEPEVLCIGNFYEGKNTGTTSQVFFFSEDVAERDGITRLIADGGGTDEPVGYAFNHPLNAEVHDLAIKQYYMSDVDIAYSASTGPLAIDRNWTSFYLPPFFVEEAPFRKYVGDRGGILQTPFFEIDGTTTSPFNVAMSFGVNGHYINIENYLRDFASDVFPRCHHMTGTAFDHTTQAREANAFLYDDPYVVRRNTLIMPCDDGLFVPSYELLASESSRARFIGDDDVEDLSLVHLDNLLRTSSLLFGSSFESIEGGTDRSDVATELVNTSIGFTPENPGIEPGRAFLGFMRRVSQAVASGTTVPGVEDGAPLTIYNRTRDPSSNQVTFFDISNLFYGKRILPGSLTITDPSFTGSAGKMSITLKDDSYGNVYRADCLTSASTWNSVGTIFYDEGIIAIKNPHLYFYGKDGYEINFRGEQNIHTLKLEVIAPQNQLNSSSNPNFMPLSASGFKTDTDPNYVYITGLNFHDENLNVVVKTALAQPIVKRHGDRIMFKVTIDVLFIRMPAIKTAVARKRKLALCIQNHTYLLYDAAAMIDYLENDFQEKINKLSRKEKAHEYYMLHESLVYQKFVVALIKVKPGGKEQWGAATVEIAAAEDGYGPLIYDIAMEHEGSLTSDRSDVTKSASKVWSYYKNNRPDVKAKKFDDKEHPKTPERFDDSLIHSGGEDNPLNYVYIPSKTPNADGLINNHKAIQKMLQTNGVEIEFSEFGLEYFHSRYHTE